MSDSAVLCQCGKQLNVGTSFSCYESEISPAKIFNGTFSVCTGLNNLNIFPRLQSCKKGQNESFYFFIIFYYSHEKCVYIMISVRWNQASQPVAKTLM